MMCLWMGEQFKGGGGVVVDKQRKQYMKAAQQNLHAQDSTETDKEWILSSLNTYPRQDDKQNWAKFH